MVSKLNDNHNEVIRGAGEISEDGLKYNLRTRNTSCDLIVKTEKVGSYEYIGQAPAGSATSESVWRIIRVETATDSTNVLFADSDPNERNAWDDRASLSYG